MESNRAAGAMFDTLRENCIFYISPMYEFSHSQGHKRQMQCEPKGGLFPLCPKTGNVNAR
jgi:hypothetical protein